VAFAPDAGDTPAAGRAQRDLLELGAICTKRIDWCAREGDLGGDLRQAHGSDRERGPDNLSGLAICSKRTDPTPSARS
jgi:hypothetical protein